MDNLCHTLAGAALGEAGLKRKTGLGMATLLIASNLPDVDAAVFFTDTLAMSFRRGWTHGVLAMAVLPGVLAAAMYGVGRLRQKRSAPARASAAGVEVAGHGSGMDGSDGRPDQGKGTAAAQAHQATRGGSPGAALDFRALLLLSYLGTWLHVFMDWLNSYGIRLLMPFSNRWFYGDALYIVDPLLYLVLGVGVVMARRAARRGSENATRPARAGLVVAGVYAALMLGSNWWARAEVRGELMRAGRPDARFMVTPVFGNPFRREVIVHTGGRYEKGVLWFDPLPHFRPLGYGVDINADDPAAVQAARTPRFQAFLSWSRFPFFVVERRAGSTRVYINDYRYSGASGRDGWATQSVELN